MVRMELQVKSDELCMTEKDKHEFTLKLRSSVHLSLLLVVVNEYE
jgi:hypothetical protein